ncbi:MAG: peptidoglycan DD-metalloendopeptidase family protein [Anaeromicrobium sp.]|uniref:peptidoglycan DD-metalloendopeptidase family protein n=1 Tax=Anaeromicrobium sp. TaxID=1929132 RepID=UPI0025D17877|nr:peptidoglycan DD-metalloendopeptidase family protein [Anaeromicrobium sp.]MCT4593448.1 peptidoglycan DD-metalloendopeptidase family protein [Anaeromicrobium sp.]
MDLKKIINENKKVSIGISIFVLMIISYTLFANSAYEVKVNGKVVGIVKNKVLLEDELNKMKKQVEEKVGIKIVDNNKLEFEKINASKDQLTSEKDMISILSNLLNYDVEGFAINIDGEEVVVLKDEETAQDVLEEVKKSYMIEGSKIKEATFKENVKVEKIKVPVNGLKEDHEAVEYILTGGIEEKIYKVQKGDTAWDIAIKLDMPLEEIEKANEDVNIERLKIGQEIKLNVPKTYVHVKTIELVSYEEDIDYNIEYEKSSALYEGDKKIKKEGIKGKKQIEAEVTSFNGKEESRTLLKESVISKPEKMIVITGTKKRVFNVASGNLYNPTRGTMTSRFGTRWGRRHTGIDIASKIGTPIKAAQGGKVVFSGWKGNYGKLVMLDHGNGYKTYYGHCSSLLVKKGDIVKRGQLIAKVGNTGRSTGPHVHFEVRKNNVPLNPLKYVKY